jgi:hypothetical protein
MALAESLPYLINHIFLPSSLPQTDDSNYTKDRALLIEVKTALTLFQKHDTSPKLATCVKMVKNLLELRDGGGELDGKTFMTLLKDMDNAGTLRRFLWPDHIR